ncbi:uncharacterized protein PG998_010323 [Apiospora kogelbergensis]|uniref:uncharacterized protein n=1 Tax=Apiospora kogelbergensis TaxID=1337665 RepID=UPI00312FD046
MPQSEHFETNQPTDLAFEVITTYSYIPGPITEDNIAAIQSVTEPTYSIRICSPAIIHALRTVVQYYPDHDLNGVDIRVSWPYCILVHHYDELQEFAKIRSGLPHGALCMRDRLVMEHMETLIQYLDDTVMEGVRAEMERNARGFYTYDHAWVSHKPGRTLLVNQKSATDWKAGVIKSISGGIFKNPPEEWATMFWSLQYDGAFLSRTLQTTLQSRFDGEVGFEECGEKILETAETDDSKDPVVEELAHWGRIYCRLLKNQCMHHKGQSPTFPNQQVRKIGSQTALRNTNTFFVHQKLLCSPSKQGHGVRIMTQFLLFQIIPLTDKSVQVHVKNLRDPEFDETMIESLIINEGTKQTLTSLAKSFARRNKAGEEIPKPMWSADFVLGKGTGLTFLLHGKPGVGKTLTAAAFTKRPLMILTSSDIGVEAEEVEGNLTKHFRNAKNWGAVLLIDEADVFMERRTTADLTRNSLVAGFLRALEYYEGILFLTTNRVGSFDDAFISRVHVQLYYPEFDDEQRQKVWKTFIDKLGRDRGGYMRLNMAAKEYIEQINKSSLKWNGREIRNGTFRQPMHAVSTS